MIVEKTTQEDSVEQLREQLLQAQRLSSLGAVASSVAHELNNVLTAIMNHANLALRPQSSGENQRQALEKILRNGKRAAEIVNGMLGFSRRSSVAPDVTDVVTLVEEVLLLTEKDLNKYRIRLEKHYHAHPQVLIFATQIEQVLVNLILNARQAMPQGGRLRLDVKENSAEGLAEIRLADTGCGIPKEKLRDIFQPFYTTKSPDEQGHGGTGLGLSICRQIIEQHNGRIRVESLVGRGSVFTIKLPLHVDSAVA